MGFPCSVIQLGQIIGLLVRLVLCNPGSISTAEKEKNRRWLQSRNQRRSRYALVSSTNVRSGNGLEVQLCSELISPRISDHAAGLSEVRVSWIAGVVATQVGVIERVEHIESDADRDRSSAEAWKIFAQTHIDVLVRERTGRRETSSLKVGAEALASDIDVLFATKRNEAGPLYAERVREICDPVRDDAMFLVVHRVLFDRSCLRESKCVTQVVLALEEALGIRISEASAPSQLIQRRPAVRFIELERHRVIPGFNVVGRVNDRRYSMRTPVERKVATRSVVVQPAGGDIPCELVSATLRRIRDSSRVLADKLSDSKAPLRRFRDLVVVIH